MYLKRLHVLPNSLFDDINLLRLNLKQINENCTINESYPSLEKTEINNTTSFEQFPENFLSRMTASQPHCTEIRKAVIVVMQSANHTGIIIQKCHL